ncbi:DUF6094 domain-containing protein [Hyphococcus luteus]|uniref:SAM-dependent methyltransferase n=1 Tax=Hyphococcus luteus TaxID=2058213 RepID=A0A2S7K013_9PROT|nr:DUF6094 domain-containing protein [Marinicaulis flavus]PQA85840.1 SAM-dependent methyltransferase [Marinicaulis flavus]
MLMFQRIALNFAKNGYFPTDEGTLERLLPMLAPADDKPIKILDPCCGEGTALAEIKHALGAGRAIAYGVELDKDRAYQAKALLDHVIHGDMQRCRIQKQAFGLLFLNPPYGRLMADRAQTGLGDVREKRLEQLFLRVSLPSLKIGGVMVLIVPDTCLNTALTDIIAANFDCVRVFRAVERRFRQLVILGVRVKRRTSGLKPILPKGEDGAYIVSDETAPILDPAGLKGAYAAPGDDQTVKEFLTYEIEPEQLAAEIKRFPCLWGQFEHRFRRRELAPRRPLRKLSKWHLSLMLASGELSGLVEAKNGRRLLLKGDTFKAQDEKVEFLEPTDDRPGGTTVTTRTDRFVPVIKAIDLTEGAPTFGQVLTIK